MFARPAVLALVLAIGTAAAAPAQSDEYPFRRFRLRTMPQVRFQFENSFRLKHNAERVRKLALDRSHQMADRVRQREFANWDRNLKVRNRALELRNRAQARSFDLKLRGWDRENQRFNDRFDHFKITRPVRLKRHSRII